MDELMFDYATKEYVQARIAEVMFMAANSGGGGGGGAFVVNVTRTTEDGETYTITADKTSEEIFTAIGDGAMVVAKVNEVYQGDPSSAVKILPLISYNADYVPTRRETTILDFAAVSGALSLISLSYTDLGNWYYNFVPLSTT